MREHVARRGRVKGWGRVGIDLRHDLPDPRGARGDGAQDRLGAPRAMRRKLGDARLCILDGRAMPRPEPPDPRPREAPERGQILPHVAVGRRDEACGPAHDMIARKRPLGREEAQMIVQMPGRVQRAKSPAVARDLIAVAQRDVGGKVGVDPLAAAEVDAAGETGQRRRGRARPGKDRGARPFGDLAREGGMIAVAMGDDDPADARGADRVAQRGAMARVARAGVDQREPPLAQQIAVRARPGQRRGVRRHDPAQGRPEPVDAACHKIDHRLCPFALWPACR